MWKCLDQDTFTYWNDRQRVSIVLLVMLAFQEVISLDSCKITNDLFVLEFWVGLHIF